jgi:hypothetical protein
MPGSSTISESFRSRDFRVSFFINARPSQIAARASLHKSRHSCQAAARSAFHAHINSPVSELQVAFGHLFVAIIRPPNNNPLLGKEIRDAIPNDRLQRDILAASLRALYEKSRPAKRLLWAITVANKLSTYRNDIIHSAMTIPLGNKPEIVPSVTIPFKRYWRLYQNQIDVWVMMRLMSGDLTRLAEYVSETSRQL